MPTNYMESLRALLRPKPGIESEQIEFPSLPSQPPPNIRETFLPGPEQAPPARSAAPNMAQGVYPEAAPGMSWTGGRTLGTEGALSGLRAAQGAQFSPFSEGEMTQMLARDPGTTAPGAASFWGPRLQESQERHAGIEGIQRKALEGISGAIAGTHPAVQFQQEQAARRASMPETIRAQGQFRSAQEAAQSRRDVGEANLERGMHSDRAGMADMVMQAIRAMRAKQGGLVGDDAVQLRALENLYDSLSDPLSGATFEEAYDNPNIEGL